jgi:hypothetical protein
LEPAVRALERGLRDLFTEVLPRILGESARATVSRLRTSRALAEVKVEWEFNETNPAVAAWAKRRAAELVEGITEETRERIRALLEQVLEGDLPEKEAVGALEEVLQDASRAELIARTETAHAATQGQQQLWDQAVEAGLLTGKERQEWITTPDDALCPLCAPMDGVQVALGESFDFHGESLEGPPGQTNSSCKIGLAVGS